MNTFFILIIINRFLHLRQFFRFVTTYLKARNTGRIGIRGLGMRDHKTGGIGIRNRSRIRRYKMESTVDAIDIT